MQHRCARKSWRTGPTFQISPCSNACARERRQRRVIEPSARGPYEVIVADAGYCAAAGIEYVWQHGADVLGSRQPSEFRGVLCTRQTYPPPSAITRFLLSGAVGAWRVVMHGQGSAFAGRLCAVAKSDRAIQQAHRRLRRKASKKQMITGPKTLEF
jgi:hypothetical protein